MINSRWYDTGASVFYKNVGKVITKVSLSDNRLVFEFADGARMALLDNGQECCETRYMEAEDDLGYYSGAILQDAEIADAPNIEDKYGDHEVQFLRVITSKGVFAISNHNEHNGYYGGFDIVCKDISDEGHS